MGNVAFAVYPVVSVYTKKEIPNSVYEEDFIHIVDTNNFLPL